MEMISRIPHKILSFTKTAKSRNSTGTLHCAAFTSICSQNPNSPLTWIGSSLELGFFSFLGFASLVQVPFRFLLVFFLIFRSFGLCFRFSLQKIRREFMFSCQFNSILGVDLWMCFWELLADNVRMRRRISRCVSIEFVVN